MLAAAGLGLHAGVPAAVRAMARAGKVSEPDPAAVRVCDEVWRERVRPLYPRLRPLLRRWHEVAGQGR